MKNLSFLVIREKTSRVSSLRLRQRLKLLCFRERGSGVTTRVRGERSSKSVFCFLGAYKWRHVLSFGEDIVSHPVLGSSVSTLWFVMKEITFHSAALTGIHMLLIGI